MPYRMPIFTVGGYYHIYNRGLDKKRIFQSGRDYLRFEETLENKLLDLPFRLHAYCLMPNHFHLLIEQMGELAVTIFMNGLLGSYAQYFNKKHEAKGPLFEGRFQAKRVIDDDYLIYLSKYIHRNPTEADMCTEPLNYLWSSYRDYLSEVSRVFIRTDIILGYFNVLNPGGMSYKEFVEYSDEDDVLKIEEAIFNEE